VFPYAPVGSHAASTDDAVVHDGQADEWQYCHSIEVLQALGLNPSVRCSSFALSGACCKYRGRERPGMKMVGTARFELATSRTPSVN